MIARTYDARTRYIRTSGQYAADAIQYEQDANTLTGSEREIAELCANAARQLSRWHAIQAHKTVRQPETNEGAN